MSLICLDLCKGCVFCLVGKRSLVSYGGTKCAFLEIGRRGLGSEAHESINVLSEAVRCHTYAFGKSSLVSCEAQSMPF